MLAKRAILALQASSFCRNTHAYSYPLQIHGKKLATLGAIDDSPPS
jgi:hypothetical protein